MAGMGSGAGASELHANEVYGYSFFKIVYPHSQDIFRHMLTAAHRMVEVHPSLQVTRRSLCVVRPASCALRLSPPSARGVKQRKRGSAVRLAPCVCALQ